MTLEAGTRLGPYEIVDSLGSGGMGEVFRARDTRLDRSVAIKILSSEFAGNAQLKLRFDREAKTISQLNHPNICTLHDVGHERDVDFLVMELCDGQSLADRLLKGPLPLEQALRIAIEIAGALDLAHRSGVVHRDLKPGNIMLTKSGAKLLDFGLAKGSSQNSAGGNELTGLLTEQKPLTAEGTILGTVQYMAPEQLEGAEADARGDIFAFGAVLYEMVTGRRAFDGKTRASVIASILDRDPVPLSQIQPVAPVALERIVKACIEKSPEKRWQSAHDLKRELEWLVDSGPDETREVRGKRRMRAPLVAALIALPLIAAAATFVSLRLTAPAPRRLMSNISPPPHTHFVVTGDAAGPVTLAPNGHMAAFVATDGTVPRLWLQSLDSGAARALPATENAMFPFWSPDSHSIGYFSTGKLMAIDIDGSTPRQIAYAPDGRGGMWLPDGRIIFTPFTQAGLYSVRATGGNPKQITFPKPPYTTDRWPSPTADGKHMVYIEAMHGSPADPGTALVISTLDGKDPHKLTPAASSGLVFRDHLLFVRSDRLMAQKLENGALSGPVISLLDGVLTDPGTWRSIVSVSNDGLLATYPSGGGSGNLRLIWMDSSGKEIGEAGPPAVYRDVALSPDGQKLALTIGDPNALLYVEDIGRGTRSRLSFLNNTADPVWTPDGKSVVFQQSLNGSYSLMIKPADGSAMERTIVTAPYAIQPTSIDGERGVVIYNALLPGDTNIMAVPLSGGTARTVLGGPGQQQNGAISPDGRWLAYVDASTSGRYTYVTTYPEPGPKWQVSDDATYKLWWSANGKEIRYLRDDGQIRNVAVMVEGKAVQFGPPRLGTRVNINTNREAISLSSDGSRFIAATLVSSDPGPATLVVNFDQPLK